MLQNFEKWGLIMWKYLSPRKVQYFKYIIDFCNSCLRIKYPVISNSKSSKDSFELISVLLTCLVNLLLENGVSDEYLSSSIKKLLKKFTKSI